MDRDYYRNTPRGRLGGLRVWSVTTWLIAINVAMYLIDVALKLKIAAAYHVPLQQVPAVAQGTLSNLCYFSIDTALKGLQAWRVVTCQFVHENLWHILSNMIGLWIFGEIVERPLGRRRFLFFYLLCGIAGPVMYTALWTWGFFTAPTSPAAITPLLGASAGIFGILVAAAYLDPERPMFVLLGDVPLKVFAWVLVGVAAYTIIIHGANSGGQAAHLGGAILGYVLIRNDSALNVVAKRYRPPSSKPGKDWSKDLNR